MPRADWRLRRVLSCRKRDGFGETQNALINLIELSLVCDLIELGLALPKIGVYLLGMQRIHQREHVH